MYEAQWKKQTWVTARTVVLNLPYCVAIHYEGLCLWHKNVGMELKKKDINVVEIIQHKRRQTLYKTNENLKSTLHLFHYIIKCVEQIYM